MASFRVYIPGARFYREVRSRRSMILAKYEIERETGKTARVDIAERLSGERVWFRYE